MWWLLGAALLGAVITVSLHLSEERQLVEVARKARPWWLLVALLFQALTYLAQGESYRVVTRTARQWLPLVTAFKLSLAKLFFDQALPSLGLSGTLVVAHAFEQRGISRPVVAAAMVVDMVAAHVALVIALIAALLVTIGAGEARVVVVVSIVVFLVYCVVFAAGVLALTGRDRVPPLVMRIPLAGEAVRLVQQADQRLSRSLWLNSACSGLELSVVALDAATVWVLIRSLGFSASPTGVFASFMISTLLRTVSITPGGLGAFEAASTVTLKLAGVPLPVALSATLLFRGLSFWLPMLPGLAFARPLRQGAKNAGPARPD
jgi:Mg2+-importing ATPase